LNQPIATDTLQPLEFYHLLEAIRVVNPKIKFYQASTSEMFGEVQEIPQKETIHSTQEALMGLLNYMVLDRCNYRESYTYLGVVEFLFNHESPLKRSRGLDPGRFPMAVAK